jgi:hypothetical protein
MQQPTRPTHEYRDIRHVSPYIGRSGKALPDVGRRREVGDDLQEEDT